VAVAVDEEVGVSEAVAVGSVVSVGQVVGSTVGFSDAFPSDDPGGVSRTIGVGVAATPAGHANVCVVSVAATAVAIRSSAERLKASLIT